MLRSGSFIPALDRFCSMILPNGSWRSMGSYRIRQGWWCVWVMMVSMFRLTDSGRFICTHSKRNNVGTSKLKKWCFCIYSNRFENGCRKSNPMRWYGGTIESSLLEEVDVDSLSLLCVITNNRLVLLVGCVRVVVVVVDVSGVGVT